MDDSDKKLAREYAAALDSIIGGEEDRLGELLAPIRDFLMAQADKLEPVIVSYGEWWYG